MAEKTCFWRCEFVFFRPKVTPVSAQKEGAKKIKKSLNRNVVGDVWMLPGWHVYDALMCSDKQLVQFSKMPSLAIRPRNLLPCPMARCQGLRGSGLQKFVQTSDRSGDASRCEYERTATTTGPMQFVNLASLG